MLLDRRAAMSVTLGLGLPALARAQSWPAKPIRLVVPYAPGGGTDILARALADALRPVLPQPMVVENRAGAAGVVGTEQVARAEPDGHTLTAVVSTHVMNSYTMERLPYDALRDVTPVSMLTRNTMVLVTGAGQPFRNLAELREQAGRGTSRLSTGSTEALSQFIGQEFARRLGVEIPDVSYRSGGQLMTDIVAGHLPLGCTSTASVTPHVATGKVRPLAVSTATRTPFFPDVPTAQEQGLAGFDLAGWVGLLGPKGMPPALAGQIHRTVAGAFASEAFRARLATLGIEPDLRPPAELMAAMEREDRIWAEASAAGRLQRQ
ncbi:tripartite tricarboxylate transporter substrate binding protein [Roseomonas sp. SSH11]|uniref:Tripartite tricarboxylate transporter substrate binding protein n=1 Tax=Pararoseomonas baculiformis TaxID=2820812 RepID=A0ABS4AI30_9PROT|nr:tripartite tricarboxylate transporter substrate binding protein [Pararoseomonas baculiformis]MBP0446656.1 tripartite tricarboxylate transporter substrate binding protein [Pararoseomonas baculiformis]